jgi:hypothetical protein
MAFDRWDVCILVKGAGGSPAFQTLHYLQGRVYMCGILCYVQMKGFTNEMAAADKRLDDEEVISYILAGLDIDFNPFVEAFTAKTKPQTLNDLYSQLLISEARVEAQKEQQQINVNAAFRGSGRGGRGHMHGCSDGGFRGCGGGRHGDHGNKIPCQVYGKTGHSALRCYKCFDASYNGEEKHANAASTGYNVDPEWYIDTGATDHIISELDKLAIHERYDGSDQVHTASGSGMPISHIGHTTIQFHNHDLVKNILHVLNASKNLVFIHKFTYDNNAFFEFHHWHFLLKYRATRKPLLRGRCKNGLYPLLLVAWQGHKSPNKSVLATIKPSMARWHHRLGHASSSIVHRVVNSNNLSCSKENLEMSVCDACQKAKSHQLPFPKSSSVSKVSLELVFSDVWAPAPSSVGKFKYYVSFIDDFSKFTSIYLLKNKSDVFHKFHDFQQRVECVGTL